MRQFPTIDIEGKKYPSVIMGEDRFTGWFGKKLFSTEKQRAEGYRASLDTAYSCGVRGFSISPHDTLVSVLKEFKAIHPDIICISNHHWHTNYYLGNKSLWLKENIERLGASEAYYYDKKLIKDSEWFKDIDVKNKFSKEDIGSFRLDEEEYLRQLDKFSFCDFFLVGNLGRSALVLLGRDDIVRREIELVRQKGRVPVGMCEGGCLVLPKMEKMDVACTWIWINKHTACPNLDYALKVIKKSKKPITAYKVFSGPKGFNFEESIKFIESVPLIKSIVVGVENSVQAKETFSKLNKRWCV